MPLPSQPATYRFGAFELDTAAYELRREGRAIRLARQPMEVLILLVERRRTLVTRDEIAGRLWGDDVFVDRDAGLHTAILKIRQILGDPPSSPVFVETVTGKGYRFMASVEVVVATPVASTLASPVPESREAPPPTNLMADLTTFVGRERELSDVTALMGTNRLVSLTGVGGSGKTRLAQQAGIRLATTFPHGVWFVDLAPVANPELVPGVVAHALDVPEKAAVTIADTLAEWLRSRHLLLILDNCEHLIDACAVLATSLLRVAPALRILATTREALNVPGECVWLVPPLQLPPASDALATKDMLAFDAVRLFAERAWAVTSFQLTPENVTTVAEICRRLDGVPLAIELAAARVKLLSVDQIRERLRDRFRLLTGDQRTVVARQRTLEATVDWSYDLLTEPERLLLARLSVFAGGWTLEAAEEICAGGAIRDGDVLELLARLVDKSLVLVDDVTARDRRYRLLETIRQYAQNRLGLMGDAAVLAQAHFRYFLTLARRAESKLLGADQVAWLNLLDVEHDNLRTAIDAGLADPARHSEVLTLATSLWWFWTKRGYLTEGRRRLERALDVAQRAPRDLQARALIGVVHLASFQGDAEGTRIMTERALTAAREAGDPWSEAFALAFTAVQAAERGEFMRSKELGLEARKSAERCTPPFGLQPLGLTSRVLAYSALQAGELDRAGATFEETIAFLREAGEVWALGIILSDLAALRVIQGRLGEAEVSAREALALCRSLRDRRGVGWCLQSLAMIDTAAGRARRAAWLYGAADALLQSLGAMGQVTFSRVQDRYLTLSREAIGDSAFLETYETGRATPIARIMDAAPPAL
jgi:predicted ATPase/DNA-binding winged helix-turn-helix (wHTH) protein